MVRGKIVTDTKFSVVVFCKVPAGLESAIVTPAPACIISEPVFILKIENTLPRSPAVTVGKVIVTGEALFTIIGLFASAKLKVVFVVIVTGAKVPDNLESNSVCKLDISDISDKPAFNQREK